MNTLTNPERVQIWNTFFHQAWLDAKTLHDSFSGSRVPKKFSPKGGTLKGDERTVLAVLVQCTLAIEARANHLIDELIEKNELTEAEGKAAQRLPTREKWFLLPRLAGSKAKLSADKSPHQAVAMICRLRNDLVHVNFKQLKKTLPKPGPMLALFREFARAVDDMNIKLKRSRRGSKKLREVGTF